LKVGKVELEVLVHQTQKHPVMGDFTHIDFYAITRGEKLTTNIHLNFVGEAPAAKEGMLIQEVIKEIEVSCLPRDLKDHFDVDISTIVGEGDTIKVSDLGIDSEKYELSLNDDDVIVTCSVPRVVEEESEETEEEVVTGSDEDVANKEAEAEGEASE